MSETRVFKCFLCDAVCQVEGPLTTCPYCGRSLGLIEGKIRDSEAVESATLPVNQREFGLELKA